MVNHYTFYNTTGAIEANLHCTYQDLLLNPREGCTAVLGKYEHATHYFDKGFPKLRTKMQPTVMGRTISNLPIPCKAEIEGTVYDITDGSLELDVNLPGPYTIKFTAVPHLDETVIVQ